MITDIGSELKGAIHLLEESPTVAFFVLRNQRRVHLGSVSKILIGDKDNTFCLPIMDDRGGNIPPQITAEVFNGLMHRMLTDEGDVIITNDAMKALVALHGSFAPLWGKSLLGLRCTSIISGLVGHVDGCMDLIEDRDERVNDKLYQDIIDLIISLYDRQMEQIKTMGMENALKLEYDVLPILIQMQLSGIKVNPDAVNKVNDYLEARELELRDSLPTGFDEKNNNDVCRLFGFSNNAGLSTPVNVTVDYLKQTETGRKIIELRSINGYRSSINAILRSVSEQGYIHPNLTSLSYDRYGESTGKIYCSRPNIQAVPRSKYDDGTPNIKAQLYRDIFVATPGHVFVEFDYSAFELRLMANLTKNKEIIALIDDAVISPYERFAATLGVHDLNKAKKFLLGFNHGLSTRTMVGQLNLPYTQVKAGLSKMIDPILKLRKRYEQAAMENGRVKTPLGRILIVDKPHLAFSRVLQAYGAELLKGKLRSLSKRGYKVVMCNQDSIIVELMDDQNLQQNINDIQFALEKVNGSVVDFKTKFNVSPTFHFE